jgi:hypothetical protein
MKRVVATLLAAGLVTTVTATPSRILSMGKHDAFFMDEMSIFRNPANISVYPNMLMGSYGDYDVLPSDTSGSTNYSSYRTNRDPRNPYFGAVFTYSLQNSSQTGNQYPMLSVAGFFNRKDATLKLIDSDSSDVPDPVGKVDLMLSYAFPTGGMVGIGGYIAHQVKDDNDAVTRAGVYKGNVGLNWPVARAMELEADIGLAMLRSIGSIADTNGTIVAYDTLGGSGDMVFNADVRMFSALSALNGDFVPSAGVKYYSLREGDLAKVAVNGGVGININIDKGFFWAGIQGLYNKTFLEVGEGLEEIGGRVSFGIERNIIFDWFLLRVGGMKTVMHQTENKTSGWAENPEHDSEDDMLGLGFGINIENRFKIDLLVAEDVQNTFTNLISGPQHHIFTRLDATFSF